MSRPSENWTLPLTPVHCCGVDAGTWARLRGNGTGRWPLGSLRPNSTLAGAAPSTCPGYQSSSTACTDDSHGIVTGAPAWTTTTVFGFAAETAEISSSWAEGSARLSRSAASVSVSSETTPTAFDADFAALTAGAIAWASAVGVAQVSAAESPLTATV